jgi:hypothetical protein
MMRLKSTALALVLLFALAAGATASAAEDPVGTAAMLDIGLGARALGMGGAHIAVADDAAAVYYNPAGLAFIDGRHITSLYTNQFGAAGYMGLGYAQRYVGAGAMKLDASGIDETDEFANVTGVFGVTDLTLILGAAARAMPQLGVGGAVKYYSQALPANSGRGVTGDIGVLFATDSGRFRIGAVCRNALGSLKYDSGHTDAFDRSFGAGVAVRPMDNLLLAADVIWKDGMDARIGGEFRLGKFALRAGGGYRDEKFSFSVGAGFVIPLFSIDYAYQTHSTLPDSHRLSLCAKF